MMFRGRQFGGRQFIGRQFGETAIPRKTTGGSGAGGGTTSAQRAQVTRHADDFELFEIALAIIMSGALDE